MVGAPAATAEIAVAFPLHGVVAAVALVGARQEAMRVLLVAFGAPCARYRDVEPGVAFGAFFPCPWFAAVADATGRVVALDLVGASVAIFR